MGKLFGSSGIRGISNKNLTPDLAMKIGLSIVTEGGTGEVLIAHDTRISKDMFLSAMTSGLLSAGAKVKIIGLATTPTLAYLTKKLGASYGIMITASHNPPQYNGIKIFDQDGIAYDEFRENRIENILFSGSFQRVSWNRINPSYRCEYEIEKYKTLISEVTKFEKEWNIAVDFGCGASCLIGPRIFKELGINIVPINAQPDGFFPGRSPEPDQDSLIELCMIVKELKMDGGIAYDGDADRFAIVDETGNFLIMDKALARYSAYLVEKEKGNIVVPIDTSLCVEEAVTEKGGKIIKSGIGDSKVAKAIIENKAIFGGEVSGAWINPKFHFCPDGILSSVLFLKAVEENEETISKYVSKIRTYPTLRTKINCQDELKPDIIQKYNVRITERIPNIKEILTLDGVRITTEDGWLLVRPSGTEPTIRIVSEATKKELSQKYFDIGLDTIKEILKEI